VSRRHATIVIAGGVAVLEDVGSKSRIDVKGHVVTTPLQLADGDRIKIGAFQPTFRAPPSGTPTETEQG